MVIYPLYDFHKSFHVTSLRVISMSQGGRIANRAPEKECLYNFWSLDSQNWGTFLHTWLASPFSSSKMSSLGNNTIWSIQLSPTLIWWIWTFSPFISINLHRSSTKITRGKLCVEEVARVARESSCVFLLRGICYKEKKSNFDCKPLGVKHSFMALAYLSLNTSSLTASECSLDECWGGYFLGITDGLSLKWW